MLKRKNLDAKQLQNQGESLAVDRTQPSDAACYQPGGSQFFGPLENSAALEAPKLIYQSPANLPVVSTENSPQLSLQSADSTPLMAESHEISPQANLKLVSSQTHPEQTETVESLSDASKLPMFEETISLLEERLVIDSHKRKVGEVIVRKEIETRIIEVPVRREKLVVEQISPTFKQLAVVDLGQVNDTEFDQVASSQTPLLDTTGYDFDDANAAIQFLEAIAAQSAESHQTPRISVVLWR